MPKPLAWCGILGRCEKLRIGGRLAKTRKCEKVANPVQNQWWMAKKQVVNEIWGPGGNWFILVGWGLDLGNLLSLSFLSLVFLSLLSLCCFFLFILKNVTSWGRKQLELCELYLLPRMWLRSGCCYQLAARGPPSLQWRPPEEVFICKLEGSQELFLFLKRVTSKRSQTFC